MADLTLPCYIEWDTQGNPRLIYEMAFALNDSGTLHGTDCPGERCSVCNELVEEGVKFCSNCGRRFINNA